MEPVFPHLPAHRHLLTVCGHHADVTSWKAQFTEFAKAIGSRHTEEETIFASMITPNSTCAPS